MLKDLKLEVKSFLKMQLFFMTVFGHLETLSLSKDFFFPLHTRYIKLSFVATAGAQTCPGRTWMAEAPWWYVAFKKSTFVQ